MGQAYKDVNNPDISVIIPAYNAELYIAQSIASVLEQTYPFWELIVINDGSTDRTQEIIESHMISENRIRLINQSNNRLGAARNAGLRAARGTWIAFLDADDLWHPTKLEKQIDASKKHPEADIIYTDGYILFENDFKNLTPYATKTGLFTGASMYTMEYETNYIPVQSVLFKNELVAKIGFQEEGFYGCEDWDYWLRLAKAGAIFLGLDEKLFYYRRHGNNMSSDDLNMRISKASVFIKNYDPVCFTPKQKEDIFNPLLYPLIIELIKVGRLKDAMYVVNGMTKVFDRLSIKLKLLRFSMEVFGNNTAIFIKTLQKLRGINRLSLFNSFKKSDKIQPATILFSDTKDISVAPNFSIGQYKSILIQPRARLTIEADVSMREFCNIMVYEKGHLIIKKNVFFNNSCSVNCLERIEIGENTLFGEGVKIYDHNHKYQFLNSKLQVNKSEFTTAPVIIGSNCWIGSGVIILKGVEIGDNVVIGAGNLIYKSIPSNSIIKSDRTFSKQTL